MSTPLKANPDFVCFVSDLPDDSCPVIAIELNREIRSYAKRRLSDEEMLQEEALCDLFYAAAKLANKNIPYSKPGTQNPFTNLVKNWVGQKPSHSFVNEIYYFLHCDEGGKSIAEKIDVRIFQGATFKQRFGFPVPGGYEREPLVPTSVSFFQPQLEKKRFHNHPAHYSNRKIEILGRDRERAELREFADTTPGFRWLQLAGEGGQGKSCLAQDLIEQLSSDWCAGFLLDPAGQLDHWQQWEPDKHHLIVFDYVIGASEEIGQIMHTLAGRYREFEELGIAVRILLLERQRWDCGGWQLVSKEAATSDNENGLRLVEGKAQWYLDLARSRNGHDLTASKFLNPQKVVELNALPPDQLYQIIKTIFVHNGKRFDYSQRFVEQALALIDPTGRPLYAYFLQQSLEDGAYRIGWDRDTLLQYVLSNNRGKRWIAANDGVPPKFDAEHPAWSLALLATMLGHLDCSNGEFLNENGGGKPSDETLRQAHYVTDGPQGELGPLGCRSSIIVGLQPDILGEFLILQAYECEALRAELFAVAWRLDASALTAFLVRIARDFADSQVFKALLEECPQTEGRVALEGFAEAFFTLGTSRLETSSDALALKEAILWLTKAAEAGHAGAMYRLGCCYSEGVGVVPDNEEAVNWWVKGAESGSVASMKVLGVSAGISGDWVEAALWWEKAAKAGDVFAMYRIGDCYRTFLGIHTNNQVAFYWLHKAAKAGHAAAMADVGIQYARGEGVLKSEEKAVRWFKLASDEGHNRAMYHLGCCYRDGFGVEADEEMAREWFRKAEQTISVGDW